MFSFSRVFLVRWIVMGPFAGFEYLSSTWVVLHHKVYRQMQNLCMMVVKYLYVFFFNAPKKLLNHKIHKDVNFHFLCLFLMCSRKSSWIRSIFHTGDSSASSSSSSSFGQCPNQSRFVLGFGSLKLLAAVSLISSRFLDLAPDLEHFGYLQQPDSHACPSLGLLANGT